MALLILIFRMTKITIDYMKIIMDADCLIKLTKAGLKEAVCEAFSVTLPFQVKHEVVDAGSTHPDARIVARNIENRRLIVAGIASSIQRKGEHAAEELFATSEFDIICSDDKKFLRTLRSRGIPHATPGVLTLLMVSQGVWAVPDAERALEKLEGLVSADELVVVRLKLRTLATEPQP